MTAPRRAPSDADRLRSDIDRGRARDKVAAFDPAAAPLGTDAEAAGTPPDRAEIAAAEREEVGNAPPRPRAPSSGIFAARIAQMLLVIAVPAALLWLLFA
jgi:hypothetical protein